MRIAYVSTDWLPIPGPSVLPQGCNWYRLQLPAAYLRANGHETIFAVDLGRKKSGELTAVDLIGRHWDGIDIVVLQRWMTLEGFEWITGAREAGQKIVNDVDDLFSALTPENAAWFLVHEDLHEDANRDIYAEILAASDLITTSTPYLERELRRLRPIHKAQTPIKVLRNAIDLGRWHQRELTETSEPVCGWVGQAAWRNRDLEPFAKPMEAFLRSHPKIRFHQGGHIEGHPPAAVKLSLMRPDPESPGDFCSSLPNRLSFQEATDIISYPVLFKELEVSLVMLSDIPFNRAKSAIKGLESLAAGLPVIAYPTPEYEWLAKEVGGVKLARPGLVSKRRGLPRDEWLEALEELRDPSTRRRMVNEARHGLVEMDIANRWVEWESAYLELIA